MKNYLVARDLRCFMYIAKALRTRGGRDYLLTTEQLCDIILNRRPYNISNRIFTR